MWINCELDSTKAVFSADFIGAPESGGVSAVEIKSGAFTGIAFKFRH